MCGRFVSPDESTIRDYWEIHRPDMAERIAPPPPGIRYNVAPQQNNPLNYIPVVRINERGEKEIVRMQWWLLPVWAKTRIITFSAFNARVEGVRNAPAFRESLRFQRCIVPALGWYEWQELAGGNKPWFLHGRENEMLNFAALWARWSDGSEVVESCAVMVGQANTAFEGIHDRMPFVLNRELAEAWMDPGQTDPEAALALLRPNADDAIVWHRVSKRVNKATNDGSELIAAISEEELREEDAPVAPKRQSKPKAVKKSPEPKSPLPTTGDLFGDGSQ